ncbi:MAG: GNAT family N-acetyltransferase, partial [Lachnospiraceae bacterium]|nr:GNAT family N-acetyltransferase [Lachnospiraceae bacterium]
MLYLKETNVEDAEKEWLFVKDMPEDEFGFLNKWPGISFEEFKREALPALLDHAKGLNLEEGKVPETFFFLWDDDTIVGQFRL